MKKAFTLIELLVVVAIIAILAAMLAPSLQRSMYRARTTVCMANLKQWGVAVANYTNENNELLPRWDVSVATGHNGWDISDKFLPGMKPYGITQPLWFCSMNKYADKVAVMQGCPGFWCWMDYTWWVPRKDSSGFLYPAGYPERMSEVTATTILMADQVNSTDVTLNAGSYSQHKFRGKITDANELFIDGRCDRVQVDRMQPRHKGTVWNFY